MAIISIHCTIQTIENVSKTVNLENFFMSIKLEVNGDFSKHPKSLKNCEITEMFYAQKIAGL